MFLFSINDHSKIFLEYVNNNTLEYHLQAENSKIKIIKIVKKIL